MDFTGNGWAGQWRGREVLLAIMPSSHSALSNSVVPAAGRELDETLPEWFSAQPIAQAMKQTYQMDGVKLARSVD